MNSHDGSDLSQKIATNLPYLRRYARALTGSQQQGDHYAVLTLETILANPEAFDASRSEKAALFRVFQSIWATSGGTFDDNETGLAAVAQKHLSRLTANTREALLLHTLEDLGFAEVAFVMQVSETEARKLVDIAHQEMASSLSGSIMIIEDEAIIAMDLEGIVTDMGHRVTGNARTETAALDLFGQERPDLILSDIQLADNSSGIDAVNRILGQNPRIPVIFITAFPERLLTGSGPEPAFLITKPYTEDQVRSAVSQAMFFASTDPLTV